jgi:hypothetical protein
MINAWDVEEDNFLYVCMWSNELNPLPDGDLWMLMYTPLIKSICMENRENNGIDWAIYFRSNYTIEYELIYTREQDELKNWKTD